MAGLELKENPEITVILLGGMLRIGSTSVEGTLGTSILERINVDTMFTSASGFTLEAGLTDFNVYEVELKKVMARTANRLVALLDHTKIGASSIASFASVDQIDMLITDREPSQDLLDTFAAKKIELIVA
jgi:DeoR/GlpR family transcriptional regulator of sugar metabolism